MVLRHREALGDIFETYNQFVMKESPSYAKKHSPRPNESSLDKLLKNDLTNRTLPGNVTQTSYPNSNIYLGGPSGTIEFTPLGEGLKHPDFFGAIIA